MARAGGGKLFARLGDAAPKRPDWLILGTGRAMIDLSVVREYLRFTAVCAVAMPVLLTGLVLVRDTTGHDWYAARKLTATQAMLAVGFRRYAATEYRFASGDTFSISRDVLTELDGPREARERIFTVIADHAGLGAVAGIGCAVTLLIWLRSNARRARLAAMRKPARAPPVPGLLWDSHGVAKGFCRPGEGDAGIGLAVVSPTDARGVANVWEYVDLGVAVPPSGIGPERLAAGAKAARRALSMKAPRGTGVADMKDAGGGQPVEASKPPAVRPGPAGSSLAGGSPAGGSPAGGKALAGNKPAGSKPADNKRAGSKSAGRSPGGGGSTEGRKRRKRDYGRWI